MKKITKDNWFQELLSFMEKCDCSQGGGGHRGYGAIVWCSYGHCGICNSFRSALLTTGACNLLEIEVNDFESTKPLEMTTKRYPRDHPWNSGTYFLLPNSPSFEQIPEEYKKEVLQVIYRGLRNLSEKIIMRFEYYFRDLIQLIDDMAADREDLHKNIIDSPAGKYLRSMEMHYDERHPLSHINSSKLLKKDKSLISRIASLKDRLLFFRVW